MVSLVMLADSALSIPERRRALTAGSAPVRAAMVISRISLVKTLARLASSAFLRPSMLGPLPIKISCDRKVISHFPPVRRAGQAAIQQGRMKGAVGAAVFIGRRRVGWGSAG